MKNNSISNIALNIGKDKSDNNYGSISKIEKNAENWYYLVKWTSGSYNFQYSHNIGRYIINYGGLVCDAVSLNPFVNFNQWYTPYEKNEGKIIFRFDAGILGKVRVQSINYVNLHARASNKLRSGAIRLGDFYVCSDSQDEILDTIFSR